MVKTKAGGSLTWSRSESPENKAASRMDEQQMQASREWVSHGLAIAIVGATIFSALWSFKFVGSSKMEDAKALLAAMSGLSGAIIGYYFGWVPGEAHASRAQKQADEANAKMMWMERNMASATAALDGLIKRSAPGDQVGADDLRSVRQTISQART